MFRVEIVFNQTGNYLDCDQDAKVGIDYFV